MQVQSSLQQLDSNQRYNSSWDAANKILRNEGWSGIYRGYGATLLSYSPFSALYFLLYEQTKKIAKLNQAESQQEITFNNSLICSAFAGAVASYVTSPLDMAKLRLQVCLHLLIVVL